MQAAKVINKVRNDVEAFTPYRRWTGKTFDKPGADFGELPAESAGKNKFDDRLIDGMWLGIKVESGKSTIGIAAGLLNYDFGREPEGGGR